MASLSGKFVREVYKGLLKTQNNEEISGSLSIITDGEGNTTPLSLNSSTVSISNIRLPNITLCTGSNPYLLSYNPLNGTVCYTTQSCCNTTGSGITYTTGSMAAGLFMHPQVIASNIVIPENYNAFLLGPVEIAGEIEVGEGSYLSIL